MVMKITNLLHQPIGSLNLSDEFLEMASTNSFETLSDMAKLNIEVLKALPLFDHRMLAEYVSFLTENGLEGVIED